MLDTLSKWQGPTPECLIARQTSAEGQQRGGPLHAELLS